MTKWIATLAACLALAACTSSTSHNPPAPTSGGTRTIVHTTTPTVTNFKPPAPASVHPLTGDAAPKGEKFARCPYIRSGLNADDGSGVNMAKLEGDRVSRSTLLTRYKPVGCRFYFAYGTQAISDIRPYTFATTTQAFNAMVLMSRTGHDAITERDFVKGLTGISFRTKYFGPDGDRDWAFAFAKGKRMIVVYTQQNDTSRNALYIAQAIAPKF
jgi:hypothetical protein